MTDRRCLYCAKTATHGNLLCESCKAHYHPDVIATILHDELITAFQADVDDMKPHDAALAVDRVLRLQLRRNAKRHNA